MKTTRLLIAGFVLTATLLSTGMVSAQPDRNGANQNRSRRGGGRLPAAGTRLPELTIFDDTGNEFSTKVLREHHTVIVFGCLT